ncbi:hypothetical protein [Kineosporia babensis]|uniref:Uncharacterized protein n=1 Tax=Kineosporia babensis TaxID=499548 RepID=A0A9X1T501_9ACTN|nr:hypothetical protein [Kineosporia babensis]MCD5317188.1 hypothetical protein [Kineosporia babensis]
MRSLTDSFAIKARLRLLPSVILCLVAMLVASVGVASSASAATPVYGVFNASSLQLGVTQAGWPKSYNYDVVVPANKIANGGVYGIYLGGSCHAQVYTNTKSALPGWNDSNWKRLTSGDWGPGKHQTSGSFWVKIVQYGC